MSSSSSSSPERGPQLPLRPASTLKKHVQKSREIRTLEPDQTEESPSNRLHTTPTSVTTGTSCPSPNIEAGGAGPSNRPSNKQPQRRYTLSIIPSLNQHKEYSYPAILGAIERGNNLRDQLRLLHQELQDIQKNPDDDGGDDVVRREGIRQLKEAIDNTKMDIAVLDRWLAEVKRRERASALADRTVGSVTTSQHPTITSGATGLSPITGQPKRQGSAPASSGFGKAISLKSADSTGLIVSSGAGRSASAFNSSKGRSHERWYPGMEPNEDALRNSASLPTPGSEGKRAAHESAVEILLEEGTRNSDPNRAQREAPSSCGDMNVMTSDQNVNIRITGSGACTAKGTAGPSNSRQPPSLPRSSSHQRLASTSAAPAPAPSAPAPSAPAPAPAPPASAPPASASAPASAPPAPARTAAEEQDAELEIAGLWRSSREGAASSYVGNPIVTSPSVPTHPHRDVGWSCMGSGAGAGAAGYCHSGTQHDTPRRGTYQRLTGNNAVGSGTGRSVAGPAHGSIDQFLPAPIGQGVAAASGAVGSGIMGSATAPAGDIPSHFPPLPSSPWYTAGSGPTGGSVGGGAAGLAHRGPTFFPPSAGQWNAVPRVAVGNTRWTEAAGQAVGTPAYGTGLPVPGLPSNSTWGVPIDRILGLPGSSMPPLPGLSGDRIGGASGSPSGVPGPALAPPGAWGTGSSVTHGLSSGISRSSFPPLLNSWPAAGGATMACTQTDPPSLATARTVPNISRRSAAGSDAANVALYNQAAAQASHRPGAIITRPGKHWGVAGEVVAGRMTPTRARPNITEKDTRHAREGRTAHSSGAKRKAATPSSGQAGRSEQRAAASGSGADRRIDGPSSGRMGLSTSEQATRERGSASNAEAGIQTAGARSEQRDRNRGPYWTGQIGL
ncbi:hypothetical protein EPUS_05661 [Endocarpon pusillum Z07020]|uniref:Uncharacterized protein n=1 Tax=Endocarpon pusillum (strain Z07020 / HMAS-L-300199) TaxID=1263415 RepID=U1FUN8_ENDPU|nr:uncharacterized protein EPUS_05661 [Endocarpon pusillum Z07020]ERF68522.1 hypothetical protein EPUS_05661 [Endocarpon pusillum Z07020]